MYIFNYTREVSSMQTMNIDNIIINNKYLRTDSNVDKLKKSIETVGAINPLIINENNELIAGGRRYTAMKELGFTEVPIFKVNKSSLEQELISIDENLVRKDLTKVEFEQCLNRGKEIYEELFPTAKKVEDENFESKELDSKLPNEQRSFVDITAEKTGLSKKVIKSAIDRDAKSSKKIKELRSNGELNATQANEIIKLKEDDQEKIADLVVSKSAKEIKDIVKSVSQHGIDETIDKVINGPSLSTEYKSSFNLSKRLNKLLGKILLEEISCEHEDKDKIIENLKTLRNQIDQVVDLNYNENFYKEDLKIDSSLINSQNNNETSIEINE